MEDALLKELNELRKLKEEFMKNEPLSFCGGCQKYIAYQGYEYCQKCDKRFCGACQKGERIRYIQYTNVCKECVPDYCILCRTEPMQRVCWTKKCRGYCQLCYDKHDKK